MEETSGMAGPRWGGKQFSMGRISFVKGAIEISKLQKETELNLSLHNNLKIRFLEIGKGLTRNSC